MLARLPLNSRLVGSYQRLSLHLLVLRLANYSRNVFDFQKLLTGNMSLTATFMMSKLEVKGTI